MAGEPRSGTQGLHDRGTRGRTCSGNEIHREARRDRPGGRPLWSFAGKSARRASTGGKEATGRRSPRRTRNASFEAKGLDATFRAPTRAGAYRIFAYLYDGKGGAACANVPFAVKSR